MGIGKTSQHSIWLAIVHDGLAIPVICAELLYSLSMQWLFSVLLQQSNNGSQELKTSSAFKCG